MNLKILITILFFSLADPFAMASTVPAHASQPAGLLRDHHIKIRQIEKITGKKLALIEKVKLRLLEWKLKKFRTDDLTLKQKKQATWSMWLGIGSIVLLITPLSIISVPAAIVGFILGISSLKGNSNSKGIVGIVTSGVTILLLALVLFIIMIAGGIAGY